MGCANTKAGGATAYGAPEECPEGGEAAQTKTDVPKVTVDGDQDGVAVNGNAVSCVNGVQEETSGAEKEVCNGDLAGKTEESGAEAAPSAGEKCESASPVQDGGDSAAADDEAGDDNEAKESAEEGQQEQDAETSQEIESRGNNQELEEEKAE